MFCKETGQANWLRRPPALTARLENAIPLARISKDNTSTKQNTVSIIFVCNDNNRDGNRNVDDFF